MTEASPSPTSGMFDDFVARIRHIVGDAAIVAPGLGGYDFLPTNPGALPLYVGADVWLQIRAGHFGGRWQLSLTDERDARFAQDIVGAIIDGRVQERFGRQRSMVTVTREDGSVISDVGYASILSSILPDPRWRTEGRLVEYEPYVS